MYLPDLSSYGYSLNHSLSNVLNVGWLDRSMPYSKGVVPARLLEQLKRLFISARVNQMRGIHECNFCRVQQWPLLPLHEKPSVNVGDRALFLGNWEIWIPGPSGKIFASPGLIIHYIETHEYCPPEDFISAAMNDDMLRKWSAEVEFKRMI